MSSPSVEELGMLWLPGMTSNSADVEAPVLRSGACESPARTLAMSSKADSPEGSGTEDVEEFTKSMLEPRYGSERETEDVEVTRPDERCPLPPCLG